MRWTWIAVAVLATGCASNRAELHRQRQQAYLTAHPETSPEARGWIEGGLIAIGMTAEQLVASVGPWQSQSELVSASGRILTAQYFHLNAWGRPEARMGVFCTVTIINGIVTSWVM